MRFSSATCLFLAASCNFSHGGPDGGALFTQNCSACHLLDQTVVGPSLAEMRDIYRGKPEDFVKWSIAPQKKRPNLIEMPSMAHLGEEALLAIHAHVMKVSHGVRAKRPVETDIFAASPTQAMRPLVLRIFMPDASPASIAVAMDDQISLCWDAGPCRLRYAWSGGFVDGFPYWRGNGNEFAKILGTVGYREPEAPFGTAGPRFAGYDLDAKGYPTFHYRVDGMTVSESYRPLVEGKGFVRRFVLDPAPLEPLVMKFADEPEKAGIRASAGKWSGGTLTLSPSEAADFTLTHQLP